MEISYVKTGSINTEEAKEIISADFMSKFYEWLKDLVDLSDVEFSKKYGWRRNENTKKHKDNLTAVKTFQKYFYPCRTTKAFNVMGINDQTVWALARESWLSRIELSHESTRYYINQNRAKEIWNGAKGR